MSRTQRAVFGFATDIGGNVLIVAVGLLTTPIILRLISPSLYGSWLAVLSVLGYLALADWGLGVSLTRLVAGLADSKDSEALNRVISSAFFMFCAAGSVFFISGFVLCPYIPGWFKIPSGEVSEVVSAYRIAVFSSAIALPLSIFGAILSGFQKLTAFNNNKNLIALAASGILLVLLYARLGLFALALAGLFTVLVSSFINYSHVRSWYPELRIRPSLVNSNDVGRLARFGGYFQLARIANTVATSTDSIVIASTMGAAWVVPYAMTSKLAVMFSNNIASKGPIAVFPAMSQMFAQGETDKLKKVFIALSHYSTRLAVVAGLFLLLANRQFVSKWVGPQHYGGYGLNLVFVYWIFQDTIYRGTTGVVYASGDLRNCAFVAILEAVLNIIFSLILVGRLGLLGVALGTSIGKTLTTAWYVPYWICHKLNLSLHVFLWRGILGPLLRSLPGIGLLILTSTLLPARMGWLHVILLGIIALVGNVASFEGLQLLQPSNEPWRQRLRQLVKLPIAT